MKILTSNQIKAADQFTIAHEPIASILLMERASIQMSHWVAQNIDKNKRIFFLIGKGNNGGDGLAMARILHHKGFDCCVYLACTEKELTEESLINFQRLSKTIIKHSSLDSIQSQDIIIDALLGTGIRGFLKENLLHIVHYINHLNNTIISIDIPSGMKTEWKNNESQIIHADITLTLEFPKLAMLLPEAGECCGQVHIIPIGLDKKNLENVDTPFTLITEEYIKTLVTKRKKFAYKNKYGHSLLICGSEIMPGAAILATGGALRSGCGLVTTHIPHTLQSTIMVHYPSAMLSLDSNTHFSIFPTNIQQYSAIGIGCGLGKHADSTQAFKTLLETFHKPIVIDADALNMIDGNKNILSKIPPNSILTPHLGELKCLIGQWHSEKEKIDLTMQLAILYQLIIVVKGAYTMIVCPNREIYFNTTGNSGMAKGGSGDILTGIITGLLSRGYDSKRATLIGVYIHGLAGDKATEELGTEAMNSQDIISFLPQSFREIYQQ